MLQGLPPLKSIVKLLPSTRTSFHSLEPSNKHLLTSLQCGRLLQSFTNSKSLERGRRLHAHVITSGVLVDNAYLTTKLCALYAACGCTAEARALFNAVIPKNQYLWNIMVRGYACSGLPLEALDLYREMLESGERADNFSYPFVLMACGDLLHFEVGKMMHAKVTLSGYESDIYVGNATLSMYCKFGYMEIAHKFFDRMLKKDATSWNTMISGYARNGESWKSLSIFADVVKQNKERPDPVMLLSVLPACADTMALKQEKEIHAYVLRWGLEFDRILCNAVIDAYAKSGFLVGARRLFEKMGTRDTVSWNSLISAFDRDGNPFESLSLFYQMNSEGTSPDMVTLVAVLGACDQISALEFGRAIHCFIIRKGLDNAFIMGTALIDMYAKCGSLMSSCQVFNEMPTKNLVTWSAMISGYGLHGRGKEAVACFKEMKNCIRPDKVTFTSVLSACSHAGLVDEGKEIFYRMRSESEVEPSIEHFACIVDLLGRAGHLDEAYKLIMSMEMTPNLDVWAALLSACCIQRNIELAEIAAQNIFNLQPRGIGPYVSLSNMYAVEKRWNDVERVRAASRANGLRKQPGCSFVELDAEIHRFLVGDKSHAQSQSIYAKLEELKQLVKKAGYVADTSSVFYEVEEDDKEKMLWDHSERLAIAFSLLNTCPGKTITIRKNLRTCNDCHTVAKLISKLVGREIVIRDAHRFHHFLDGSCSCGDYW